MPRRLQPVRACTRCGSTTQEFYKDSKVSDGKSSWCKLCFKAYRIALHAARPELKQKHLAKTAEWVKANPEKVIARVRRYQARHPERCERVRSRRHLTMRRPIWANPFFIAEIYDLARRRTKATGKPWVVDHVIPLKNPLVSGLHVETNLQVVPRSFNAAKGNSFVID